ncbi:hypothetical protein [Pantoea sp. R13S299]|uniref:hypothetical protein n=1 Tax=Pantoea sp. R13S299 TaxID=3402751 RepID=UPI003ADDD548
MSKNRNRNKVISALSIACCILILMIIILPKDVITAPFTVSICAAIGGLIASFFEKRSNKKTEQIKKDVNINIDILYTSRKVKKSHKIILMSKVERELKKIIHDEAHGKPISLARKEILIGLVQKYKNQGIVLDTDAVDRLLVAEKAIPTSTEENKKKLDERLKNHTLTQLFLVAKRQELFWAKNILIFATATSAGLSYFFFPTLHNLILIPAAGYILLFIKEYLLTYRVNMGYFGANRFEAIQLLQYIENNKEDLDLNGPGGNKRKIFKDIAHESNMPPIGIVGGIYQ